MRPQRNLLKGLADDELQIIGLEFTIRDYDGKRSELAMFSPSGLIIPRARSINYGLTYEPAVTFHYTDGDYTIQGFNCPW